MKMNCVPVVILFFAFLSCEQKNTGSALTAEANAESSTSGITDASEIRRYLLGNWVNIKLINGLQNIAQIRSVKQTEDWIYPFRSISFDSLPTGKFACYYEVDFERILTTELNDLKVSPISNTQYEIVYPKTDSIDVKMFFNTADSTLEIHHSSNTKAIAKFHKVGRFPLKTKEPIYELVNRMLLQGQYQVQSEDGSVLFKKVQFSETSVSGFGAFNRYQVADLQMYQATDGNVYPIVSLKGEDQFKSESLLYKKIGTKIFLYKYENLPDNQTAKVDDIKYVLIPL